ncbi:MAG TPA: hypothetical protein VFW19_15960 [Allosphingosinicella sp.]|nr:hypothetical protein [Allosphingosinicella sp.]
MDDRKDRPPAATETGGLDEADLEERDEADRSDALRGEGLAGAGSGALAGALAGLDGGGIAAEAAGLGPSPGRLDDEDSDDPADLPWPSG